MSTVAAPNVVAARYVASAVRPDQYPPGDFAEIAFVGRLRDPNLP
jgi:GTP-binding protein